MINICFLSAGLYTAHKTFLHKDKILIKRLLKVNEHVAACRQLKAFSHRTWKHQNCVCLQGIQRKRPSEAQSAILRRHLLELTQSFIIPLVRKQPIRWLQHLPLFTAHVTSCLSENIHLCKHDNNPTMQCVTSITYRRVT